ncbi:hypothetical protein J7399_15505 [Shimia sp. R9_1]|uniref:hypothetical protein n=1 Tax=Shimia sp. R9_1 TaxID=2821111 RepID=UPI001ADABEA9|nr:hypothetical protein [Shimia sp. R9_1]MBO9408842.1 hypothetical protein [Shimia sp. R9_1]
MRHGFRLGDFDPEQPQDAVFGGKDSLDGPPSDDRRLMREAKRRMGRLSLRKSKTPELSNVDRAMLRNAPDLVSAEKRALAEPEMADWRRRWPRPRLLALIVVITLAAVVPSVAMRLMIWLVIMLLLTAVLLGPERARDAVQAVAIHFAHVWGREIGVLRKLLARSGS